MMASNMTMGNNPIIMPNSTVCMMGKVWVAMLAPVACDMRSLAKLDSVERLTRLAVSPLRAP